MLSDDELFAMRGEFFVGFMVSDMRHDVAKLRRNAATYLTGDTPETARRLASLERVLYTLNHPMALVSMVAFMKVSSRMRAHQRQDMDFTVEMPVDLKRVDDPHFRGIARPYGHGMALFWLVCHQLPGLAAANGGVITFAAVTSSADGRRISLACADSVNISHIQDFETVLVDHTEVDDEVRVVFEAASRQFSIEVKNVPRKLALA
jgi:hypothetical protein